MNEKSPGARAVETFQIEDVFLVSSACWVARDFNNQSPITEIAFAFKPEMVQEVVVQERTPTQGGDSYCVIRYFVKAEIWILKPGIKPHPTDAPDEASTLAALKFTFASDYRVPKEATQDHAAIGAFSRNALFHTWPYLREEVHAMCGRLRVPRVTLQMMKPDQLRGTTTEIRAVRESAEG